MCIQGLQASRPFHVPQPHPARPPCPQATLSHLVEGPGLQVIVPAFDGFLYVIDGLQVRTTHVAGWQRSPLP